jgi:hypothetical protein
MHGLTVRSFDLNSHCFLSCGVVSQIASLCLVIRSSRSHLSNMPEHFPVNPRQFAQSDPIEVCGGVFTRPSTAVFEVPQHGLMMKAACNS